MSESQSLDPDFPDMEQIWQESLRDARRLEEESRPWVERQVVEAIRRARRGRDHMTAVTLWVLVPKCMYCVYSEAKWMEEQPQPPQVYGAALAAGYWELGISRRQIPVVRRAVEDGSWRPRCYQCGSTIDVMEEGFCVRRTGILEYFGLGTHKGKKPPKWMKDAVVRGLGRRCAGCKKRLTPDKVTLDHIVAESKCGMTEMTNLQPLCQKCNGAKGNKDVEEVEVELAFPLLPPPSDGFEGVIW